MSPRDIIVGGLTILLVWKVLLPVALILFLVLAQAAIRLARLAWWRLRKTPCGEDSWRPSYPPCPLPRGHAGMHATPWRPNPQTPDGPRFRVRWRVLDCGDVSHGEYEEGR